MGFIVQVCIVNKRSQHTFWNVHWVKAAQQISDRKFVCLFSAQPIVAGVKEAEVWPIHVSHNDSV